MVLRGVTYVFRDTATFRTSSNTSALPLFPEEMAVGARRSPPFECQDTTRQGGVDPQENGQITLPEQESFDVTSDF